MSLVTYVSPSYLRRAAASPAIQRVRQRALEHLEIKEGSQVLDVGCGPGTSTMTFAQIVGPKGTVLGIDYDPQMIVLANDTALRLGVAGWTTHRVGDCTILPIAPSSVDACYCERVLQHLSQPKPGYAVGE